MAIGTALALTPTVANLAGNIFGNKPSQYEQRLGRMADIFEDQAFKSITENRAYKSGKKVADERDKRNRRAINNRSATTGATDESRIATMQSANETYDTNINRLLQNAAHYRDLMRNRAMRTWGLQERAEQQRKHRFGQKMNSIGQPLGQAINAFKLSSMFGSDDPGGRPGSNIPEVSSYTRRPDVNFNSIFNDNPRQFSARDITGY